MMDLGVASRADGSSMEKENLDELVVRVDK